MNVLFLTNIPSPYRMDFFNELGKICNLTVTFEGHDATDRDEKWQGSSTKHFEAFFLKGIRFSAGTFFCPGILFVLKKKWDVIIVSGYASPTAMLAIEYLKFWKIPFYIEVDGGIIQHDSKMKYLVKRHFLSSAEGWFSSGKATTKYLVHYGAKPKKCYHYPFTSLKRKDLSSALCVSQDDSEIKAMAVARKRMVQEDDFEQFCRLRKELKETFRRKMQIPENKMILFVGQFIYRKGIDLILELAKKMNSSIGIYLVGGKPTMEMQQAAALKTNVHFVGFKTKNELAEYYKAADVFFMPTREDIWGLVINEAMSYGLPIVTTDHCVAGVTLLTKSQIARNEDLDEMQMKLQEMLEEDVGDKVGFENLKRITPYTVEKMARLHIKVLDGLR